LGDLGDLGDLEDLGDSGDLGDLGDLGVWGESTYFGGGEKIDCLGVYLLIKKRYHVKYT